MPAWISHNFHVPISPWKRRKSYRLFDSCCIISLRVFIVLLCVHCPCLFVYAYFCKVQYCVWSRVFVTCFLVVFCLVVYMLVLWLYVPPGTAIYPRGTS